MKTLPKNLKKNGFTYTQVLRGAKSCIYEQRVHENRYAYEVFLIKISPERYIGDKKIESRERFPHNEAFGFFAWTYRSYEKALQKYYDLESNSEIK